MNKKKTIVYKILAVVLALAVWQIVSMVVNLPILLVGPIDVLVRLFTIWQEPGFFTAIMTTMTHIMLGFLCGYLLGMLAAVLAYKHSFFETLLWPWMVTIKAVPVASFVVIFLIWLTSNNLSVLISFLIVFPIAYQNILSALRTISRELLDLSRLENMRYLKKIKTVYLPQISATLISTASLTVGMAWKAGIAAEIIGTPTGSIGKELYLSKIYLDTDDLLAWTIVIVLLSVLFEKIVVALLKALLPTE